MYSLEINTFEFFFKLISQYLFYSYEVPLQKHFHAMQKYQKQVDI